MTVDPHWLIAMDEQPFNSPDNNILDLAFFHSLQACAWEMKEAQNVEGIIANVKRAYMEYDPRIINRAWLTYASCLNEIVLCQGNNNYKIPHMNKERLELWVSFRRGFQSMRRLLTSFKITAYLSEKRALCCTICVCEHPQ